MKVVKFNNGQWALRKFSIPILGWVYMDLCPGCGDLWWSQSTIHFRDCVATSEKDLRDKLKGTSPLKVVEKKNV